MQAAALLTTMHRDRCRRVAVANDQEAYGYGLAALMGSLKHRYGVRIVSSIGIDPTARSYREYARSLQAQHVDCFMFAGITASNAVRVTEDVAAAELAAAQPDEALAALLRSDAIFSELGKRSQRSTTQALLARAYELKGSYHAALEAIDLADELGAPDDVLNSVIIHRVRARLALASGDDVAAAGWARGAVEHALQTDNIILQADARLALAQILATIGQRDEAVIHACQALDQYQIKGEVPGAQSSRALLTALAVPG